MYRISLLEQYTRPELRNEQVGVWHYTRGTSDKYEIITKQL